jgi:hypothetical protein
VIPKSEVELTRDEQARWRLTKLAAALVLGGVSPDLVMLDAREGIEQARRMQQPARTARRRR